jgi:hypothetical protein
VIVEDHKVNFGRFQRYPAKRMGVCVAMEAEWSINGVREFAAAAYGFPATKTRAMRRIHNSTAVTCWKIWITDERTTIRVRSAKDLPKGFEFTPTTRTLLGMYLGINVHG